MRPLVAGLGLRGVSRFVLKFGRNRGYELSGRYTERQLEELDQLIEPWLDAYERRSRSARK